MRSKTQIKGAFFKVASLPAVRNVIVILGVIVALLIGFFTLQAQPFPEQPFPFDPTTTSISTGQMNNGLQKIEVVAKQLLSIKIWH